MIVQNIDAMIGAQFEYERLRAAAYYDDPQPIRMVNQFVSLETLRKIAKTVSREIKQGAHTETVCLDYNGCRFSAPSGRAD